MKKKNFKSRLIYVDVYDQSFHWVITSDLNKLEKFLRKNFDDVTLKIDTYNIPEHKGGLFRREGRSPILWIPKTPSTTKEYATLIHEIFHLAYDILDYAGVPLSKDSEEAYAYLLSSLTNWILVDIEKP